jgi:ketosteroid isomerase-like protein
LSVSVEDWIAISELLARYATTLDRREVDEWMDLFTEDAVIEIAGREPLTTEEQRRQMGASTSPGLHQPGPPVIRAGDRPGTAVAEQSFIFHNLANGSVALGWYRDELIKRDRWYVSRREVRFQTGPGT